MLEAYRKHAAERAEIGVVPKPLSAEQVAGLIELLKQPPAGEEDFLLELLSHRVPPGVDEAAYLKAGFLSALAKGEASSPLVDRKHAVKLLGTMLGGYNIATLVELLDDEQLATDAAKELTHTLLMFDAFHDVAEKADKGNSAAQQVLRSWADAEWFTSKEEIPEKLKFLDESMNAYFEDGAVRYLSDTYLAITRKGQEQAWTKKRWKRHLKETFADYRKKRIRFERETTHKSFRWIGLSSLVETVTVKRTLRRGNKVLRQTEGDIELTWSKSDIGWFVTEMEFQELPTSED